MNLEEHIAELHLQAARNAFKIAHDQYGKLELVKGYEDDFPHTTLSVADFLDIHGDSAERKRLNAAKLSLPWFSIPGLRGKRVLHRDVTTWLERERKKAAKKRQALNVPKDIPEDIRNMIGEA